LYNIFVVEKLNMSGSGTGTGTVIGAGTGTGTEINYYGSTTLGPAAIFRKNSQKI
jgi:hypothetical protein